VSNLADDDDNDNDDFIDDADFNYALDHFDVHDAYFAFCYIRRRGCAAERCFNEVCAALLQASKVHGTESAFYKDISQEAERVLNLSEHAWVLKLDEVLWAAEDDRPDKIAKESLEQFELFGIQFEGDMDTALQTARAHFATIQKA
jgi:hypothetical protein